MHGLLKISFRLLRYDVEPFGFHMLKMLVAFFDLLGIYFNQSSYLIDQLLQPIRWI